jgi:hypothetical protein
MASRCPEHRDVVIHMKPFNSHETFSGLAGMDPRTGLVGLYMTLGHMGGIQEHVTTPLSVHAVCILAQCAQCACLYTNSIAQLLNREECTC